MLVAAPEFKCGVVGLEAGAEKPSFVPGALASLRGTAEAAVATRTWTQASGGCRHILLQTKEMGWETGIEPATAGATVRCSAS